MDAPIGALRLAWRHRWPVERELPGAVAVRDDERLLCDRRGLLHHCVGLHVLGPDGVAVVVRRSFSPDPHHVEDAAERIRCLDLAVAREPLLLRAVVDGTAHLRVGEEAAARIPSPFPRRHVLVEREVVIDVDAAERRGLAHRPEHALVCAGPLERGLAAKVLADAPELLQCTKRVI